MKSPPPLAWPARHSRLALDAVLPWFFEKRQVPLGLGLFFGHFLCHGVAPNHIVEVPQADHRRHGQYDVKEKTAADENQKE